MRITRHSLYMDVAEVISRRSTCYRACVGALLVLDDRFVGYGYNGPPSGEPHCTGLPCAPTGVCTRATHAEVNAIRRRTTLTVEGADLYVTLSPCPTCFDIVQAHGIARVFYRHPYRTIVRPTKDTRLLRVAQNGDIVDDFTGELTEQ